MYLWDTIVCKMAEKISGNIQARSDSASDFGVDFNFAIALKQGGLKHTGPESAGSE